MAWREKAIEAAARALCTEDGRDPDTLDASFICDAADNALPAWRWYEDEAKDALDAAAAVDGDAQWNAVLDGPEFERAYGLLIRGEPVGCGDGNTYVLRVPSKDDFRAAIRSLKRG